MNPSGKPSEDGYMTRPQYKVKLRRDDNTTQWFVLDSVACKARQERPCSRAGF